MNTHQWGAFTGCAGDRARIDERKQHKEHLAMRKVTLLIATAVVGIATLAMAADYAVDATHSRVAFKIRHMGLSSVSGSFEKFEGSIRSVHVRDGLQWRRADNVYCHDTIRQLFLDELLGDLDYYSLRVKTLDRSLKEHLDKGLLARQISILKTHPGIGVVVSCQFAVELFHYRDFGSTRELSRYLGLSPRIHQSGERSVSGGINKVSNSRLRSNLVQAAWQWIRVDIEAKKTYLRLLNNCGGIKQKAIIGMARKLSGHLWTMLVNDEPYDPNK